MQKYLFDDGCLFMLADNTAFIESVSYKGFFVSFNYTQPLIKWTGVVGKALSVSGGASKVPCRKGMKKPPGKTIIIRNDVVGRETEMMGIRRS